MYVCFIDNMIKITESYINACNDYKMAITDECDERVGDERVGDEAKGCVCDDDGDGYVMMTVKE